MCNRKILFDILKKRQYNYKKRVASKRKSSLPAARFLIKIEVTVQSQAKFHKTGVKCLHF